MGLAMTQDTLDAFATSAAALTPLEPLTYHASGAVGASILSFPGRWVDYTQEEKALNPLLLNCRLLRVARPEFGDLHPQRGAVIRRVNGEAWEIRDTDGGEVHAFWYLQCRQVS